VTFLPHEATTNTKVTRIFFKRVFVSFVGLRDFVKKGW